MNMKQKPNKIKKQILIAVAIIVVIYLFDNRDEFIRGAIDGFNDGTLSK